MITRIVTRYLHLELYIEPYDINSLVYLCHRFWILCLKLEVSASSLVPWLWFCALHFLLHVSLLSMCLNVWLWITSWRKHYLYQCHRMCHVVIFHCTRHRCKLLTEGRISTWHFLCSPSLPFWLPTAPDLQVKHPVESVRGDPSSYQIIQAQRRVTKALTAIRQWETLTVWQRTSIA